MPSPPAATGGGSINFSADASKVEKRFIAVIDVGKTNAKVVLFDLQTQSEIEHLNTPNAIIEDGLYPHVAIDRLWEFMLHSIGAISANHKIDGVSITTHGACAALLDVNGHLAMPILDYEFDGPTSTAIEYDALRPPFSETGSPRLPVGLNLGAQIFWQQKSFPQLFKEVAWIVTYPQYWAHRLCGVLANEATSLGCHTDLWNHRTSDYSSLVEAQGWRRLMPPLRKAKDRLGNILPNIAQKTGLPPDTPVFCGIHDSNASLYPHLIAQNPPFAVVSTGTWVISMAIGNVMPALDATRDTLMNINAFGQSVPSARFMGGREFQILSQDFTSQPTAGDRAAALSQQMMLLPSVVNGCGPFPNAKMPWLNVKNRSPPQMQVAASFYLAMMTATCLELVTAAGPIIVEGPFANNAQYLEMLSAATGRQVLIAAAAGTGTTLGAALLASSQPTFQKYMTVTNPVSIEAKDYAEKWRSIVARHAKGF